MKNRSRFFDQVGAMFVVNMDRLNGPARFRLFHEFDRMGLIFDPNPLFRIRAVSKIRLKKPAAGGIATHQLLAFDRERFWLEFDDGMSRQIF